MDEPRLIPDHAPELWPPPIAAATTCTCPIPVPTVQAVRKGAASTVCARCGLPVKVRFAW
jgi:hypothetical protein